MTRSALLQCLEASASSTGGNDVFATLLDSEGKVASSLTYRDSWNKAGAVAHLLRVTKFLVSGDYALLIMDSSLDMRVHIIGCLRAGVVVVPCPLQSRTQLMKIVDATGAKAIVCDNRNAEILQSMLFDCDVTIVNTSECKQSQVFKDTVSDNSIAVVQLSTTLTGELKFITLSHANIFHNLTLAYSAVNKSIQHRIHRTTHHPSSSLPHRIVYGSFLPPYGGVPLIVDFLMTFSGHYHCILLPHSAFSESPKVWLAVLSMYGVNICSASYTHIGQMAASQPELISFPRMPSISPVVIDESKGSLRLTPVAADAGGDAHGSGGGDLSALMFIICTGDLCNRDAVDSFSEMFESLGLRMDWHVQVYSAVEHTAFITYEDSVDLVCGSRHPRAVRCGCVINHGRVNIRVITPDNNDPDRKSPLPVKADVALSQCVPATRGPDGWTDAPPGVEGTIWVGSDSSAECIMGWDSPTLVASKIQADISRDVDRKYVCTGDRGYIDGGCLYICGRTVDWICLDGHWYDAKVRHLWIVL